LTWIFSFHHSSLIEIVSNSLLQPTPVSVTSFVHILQFFLHPSYLFFSCVLVNARPICSFNDVIRNFHPVLLKWVLGLILISMALIHRSQNICYIFFVQAALSIDSRLSMVSFKTFNKKKNNQWYQLLGGTNITVDSTNIAKESIEMFFIMLLIGASSLELKLLKSELFWTYLSV